LQQTLLARTDQKIVIGHEPDSTVSTIGSLRRKSNRYQWYQTNRTADEIIKPAAVTIFC
jgi:hypothetical protein